MSFSPKFTSLPLILALALVSGACSGGGGGTSTEEFAPVPNEKAPDHFKTRFETTKGNILIQIERDWAPIGADRFYTLVKTGYLNGDRFFRVVPNFIIQFGLNPDPKLTARWRQANLKDDPVKENNMRGTIVFATAGPNTRTTQLFINTNDNVRLDGSGFAPFGRVIDGMTVVDQIFPGYGEQPQQPRIESEGNAYLEKEFPNLDYIKTATIVQE
ncbi:MAG TPA: peptidylprolyl isomerase [Bryobacteraceae bacterium]|jgi:peptidyl-prolyl cis-trans isomerase A (cyclophilin A)